MKTNKSYRRRKTCLAINIATWDWAKRNAKIRDMTPLNFLELFLDLAANFTTGSPHDINPKQPEKIP